jgi:hypothetical protein
MTIMAMSGEEFVEWLDQAGTVAPVSGFMWFSEVMMSKRWPTERRN